MARRERPDGEALDEDEHGDERRRADEAVGLTALGTGLSRRDEANAVEGHPRWTTWFAPASSSNRACVAMTTLRRSPASVRIVRRRCVAAASSISANGSSRRTRSHPLDGDAGQPGPPALAGGERLHRPARVLRRDAPGRQRRPDAVGRRSTECCEEAEVVARRDAAEQLRALAEVERSHGDLAASAAEGHKTCERAQQRRFPRAVRTAHHRDARTDLQVQSAEDHAITEHDRRAAQGGRTVHARMMRLFWLALVTCVLAVGCAEPRAADPIERGKQVYREKNCASCHQIGTDGGATGPALTRVGTVAQTRKAGTSAEDYIREAVLQPGAYIVPGYPDTMPRGLDRGMTQEDLDDLVRYLLTLK